MKLIRGICALIFAIGAAACTAEQSPYPWLNELDANDGVRESGARLMALPYGLHSLEQEEEDARLLLIGAHGYASRGYEWVYPLQTLDHDAASTYFYRWDFDGCPGDAARTLSAEIAKLLSERSEIEAVQLVGHSYGGVMVSTLANSWTLDVPAEIHAIAAPLAGIEGMTTRCGYSSPSSLSPNVSFFEWRTLHELDGAFKELPDDPQIVEIPGSTATRLPETYRDRRLGHNWSISWVADEIAQRDAAAQ